MDRSRMVLPILAGVVLLISAVHIADYLTKPSDIWWTPRGLSPSLTEAADRVEVYIDDERLDEQIESGRLQLLDGTSPTTITASDVQFRFNNWDHVRAQEVPALLVSAAFFGASCAVLLYGIAGWIRERKAQPTT